MAEFIRTARGIELKLDPNSLQQNTKGEVEVRLGSGLSEGEDGVSVSGSGAIAVDVVSLVTSPSTPSGYPTIDDITLTDGQVVYRRRSGSSTGSGIYIVSSGTWSRHPDYPVGTVIPAGTPIAVRYGDVWGGKVWATPNEATIGSTGMSFLSPPNSTYLVGLSSDPDPSDLPPTGYHREFYRNDTSEPVVQLADGTIYRGAPYQLSGTITLGDPVLGKSVGVYIIRPMNIDTLAPDYDNLGGVHVEVSAAYSNPDGGDVAAVVNWYACTDAELATDPTAGHFLGEWTTPTGQAAGSTSWTYDNARPPSDKVWLVGHLTTVCTQSGTPVEYRLFNAKMRLTCVGVG